jgi:hypothetical protein
MELNFISTFKETPPFRKGEIGGVLNTLKTIRVVPLTAVQRIIGVIQRTKFERMKEKEGNIAVFYVARSRPPCFMGIYEVFSLPC